MMTETNQRPVRRNIPARVLPLASLVLTTLSTPAWAGILSPSDFYASADGQNVKLQDVYTTTEPINITATSSSACYVYDGRGVNVGSVYPRASGSRYYATYYPKSSDVAGQWRLTCGGSSVKFVVDDGHEMLWLDRGFEGIIADYRAAGGPKSHYYYSPTAPAIGSESNYWVNSAAWNFLMYTVLPQTSYGFAQKIPNPKGQVNSYATSEPWETMYYSGGMGVGTTLQRLAMTAGMVDSYTEDPSLPWDPAESYASTYKAAAMYWADYLVSIPDWTTGTLPNVYKDSNGKIVYCGTGTCYYKDGAGNKIASYAGRTQLTTYFDDLEIGHMLIGLAAVYDWMYDDLDPQRRELYAKKMVAESIRYRNDQGVPRKWSNYDSSAKGNLLTNSHVWIHHAAPGIVAWVLYDELAANSWIRDQWIGNANEMFKMSLATLGSDGADHQGIGYWQYGLETMLRYVDAARTVGGDNSFYGSYWLANAPRWMMYMTHPNGQRSNVADSEYGDRGGVGALLARVSSQNRLMWGQRMAWEGHNRWSYSDKSTRRDVLDILWWDEALPTLKDINVMPRNRCFSEKGMVSVRTGWDDDAAHLVFRGGPLIGSHDDPDVGSFVLYDEGHLVTSDGTNLKSKRTSVHSTLLIDRKGQHGDGLDISTFPPAGPNSNSKLIAYLDNSSSNLSAAAPNVTTFATDLTQLYRYDSTDIAYHGSTNVEATGKKLYEVKRYMVWLGDATLVLDKFRGSSNFRVDWNLSAGKQRDVNRDGFEDSANPDTCPVKRGSRYGYYLYKDWRGTSYDIALGGDALKICGPSGCTTTKDFTQFNTNAYAPVKDASSYSCDDNVTMSAYGKVQIRAEDSLGGGRLDVLPLDASAMRWDKQLNPHLDGGTITGYRMNRNQTASSGTFQTALMTYNKAEGHAKATPRASTVSGGRQIDVAMKNADAVVLFANPGQSSVSGGTTQATANLAVVVENASDVIQVAQMVEGSRLSHRGRTLMTSTNPASVGLTWEGRAASGYVGVVNGGSTTLTLDLVNILPSWVTSVSFNGRPVYFTRTSSGIQLTVAGQGTLTIDAGAKAQGPHSICS